MEEFQKHFFLSPSYLGQNLNFRYIFHFEYLNHVWISHIMRVNQDFFFISTWILEFLFNLKVLEPNIGYIMLHYGLWQVSRLYILNLNCPKTLSYRRVVNSKMNYYAWKNSGAQISMFHIKWISGNHGKSKFWGLFWSYQPAAVPIQHICIKNGLKWRCCLAGSSKTAPKILIFFNCHGYETFILAEIHCYYLSAIKSWYT